MQLPSPNGSPINSPKLRRPEDRFQLRRQHQFSLHWTEGWLVDSRCRHATRGKPRALTRGARGRGQTHGQGHGHGYGHGGGL